MHEVKEQNFFLCTNQEKVPYGSEGNRHFLWMSKPVNHPLVIKQIESGFNILRISFVSILDHWLLSIKKRLKQKNDSIYLFSIL